MAEKDGATNLFALDQHQFRTLLDQVRQGGHPARPDDQRGIRAPELDTVDFYKWRTWRERFIATVEINSWSNAYARRELAICITGKAQDLISSINLIGGMHLNTDCKPVLADIEALIIPSSDSDMTQAQLVSARQEPNKDILKWRSWIRSLWMRAHLTQTILESKESRDLINLFLKGLARETTKTQTWAFLPIRSLQQPSRPKISRLGPISLGHSRVGPLPASMPCRTRNRPA